MTRVSAALAASLASANFGMWLQLVSSSLSTLSAFLRSVGLSLQPSRLSGPRGKIISLSSLCGWFAPSPLIALSYDLGSQIFSPIIMIIVTYKNVPLNTSPLPLTRPFSEESTTCSNTRARSK